MYYLKPDRIVDTIAILQKRISERFPDSGLSGVCSQLLVIAQDAEKKVVWFGQPVRWLRALCWIVSCLIVTGTIGTIGVILLNDDQPVVQQETTPTESIESDKPKKPLVRKKLELADFVQLMEAGINDIVLVGAAIFFLITFETRYKRGRALRSLHELRSIAHIIDMHQLTKDPERTNSKQYVTTGASPKAALTRFELRRYLDYCSEMLSLTGKIAALYVQDFEDSVALASVNEVETLCTGLSRKIWQKVLILQDDEVDLSPRSLQADA